MKTILIFLSFIIYSININALQVTALSGNSFSKNSITIEFSLDEPVIETTGNSLNIITQGLHQTKLLSTGFNELNLFETGIQVFPNSAKRYNQHQDNSKKDLIFFIKFSDILGRKPIGKIVRNDS